MKRSNSRKAKPEADASVRVKPSPVSLHPLTTEQAVGALLRTPQPGATKKPAPKPKEA
jgi:hypothetical protein